MKYLLLLIVLVLVWRHWLQRSQAQRKASAPAAAKPAETMLTCATCRVHMPPSEAIIDGDQAYCCEAHRAAAAERRR